MTLVDLGLSGHQENVYRVLVVRASATVAEVVRATGLSRPHVAAALAALAERGLVSRRVGDDEGYRAAPPAVALMAELAAYRDRLHRAEVTVAELVEEYRTASVVRAQRDMVEIIEGRDAIRQRFHQIELSARHRLDCLIVGNNQVVASDRQDGRGSVARARGVALRVVADRRYFDEEGAVEEVDGWLADGDEVRTTEHVPLKLVIGDGEVALLPLHGSASDSDPSLLLRGNLVHAVQALFNEVWERARPYGEPHPDIAALDTRILRLLLAGHTDGAVAGQLDLSTRTVQRRIQALMLQAEVTTRIELGWHARHHGWA